MTEAARDSSSSHSSSDTSSFSGDTSSSFGDTSSSSGDTSSSSGDASFSSLVFGDTSSSSSFSGGTESSDNFFVDISVVEGQRTDVKEITYSFRSGVSFIKEISKSFGGKNCRFYVSQKSKKGRKFEIFTDKNDMLVQAKIDKNISEFKIALKEERLSLGMETGKKIDVISVVVIIILIVGFSSWMFWICNEKDKPHYFFILLAQQIVSFVSSITVIICSHCNLKYLYDGHLYVSGKKFSLAKILIVVGSIVDVILGLILSFPSQWTFLVVCIFAGNALCKVGPICITIRF